MSFAHPYFLLLLLALPILAWLKGRRSAQPAFLYSSVNLVRSVTRMHKGKSGAFQKWIRWLTLALLIIALARPRLDHSENQIKASGIDIVIAIDLSSSMAAEDFILKGRRVNRVEIARNAIEEFVKRRPSDRIGLVAFGSRAYVASPLTLDHDFLHQNLDRLQLGLIEDGTAIGSAIMAGLNRLKDLQSKSKIVILMTDGQNTAGKVTPITAAQAARLMAVKVYTIGVGTHGKAPVPERDVFGRLTYEMKELDIDEPTLTEIANLTGGKYFRAGDTKTLEKIYRDIDQLEKTEIVMSRFHEYRELFWWPLTPGVVLLVLEILLTHTLWRRLP